MKLPPKNNYMKIGQIKPIELSQPIQWEKSKISDFNILLWILCGKPDSLNPNYISKKDDNSINNF